MANLSPIQFQATTATPVSEFSAPAQEESTGDFIGELIGAMDLQEASHATEDLAGEKDESSPAEVAAELTGLQILPEAALLALPVAAKIASLENVQAPADSADESVSAMPVDAPQIPLTVGAPTRLSAAEQNGPTLVKEDSAREHLDVAAPPESSGTTKQGDALPIHVAMAPRPSDHDPIQSQRDGADPATGLMLPVTAQAATALHQTEQFQSHASAQAITAEPGALSDEPILSARTAAQTADLPAPVLVEEDGTALRVQRTVSAAATDVHEVMGPSSASNSELQPANNASTVFPSAASEKRTEVVSLSNALPEARGPDAIKDPVEVADWIASAPQGLESASIEGVAPPGDTKAPATAVLGSAAPSASPSAETAEPRPGSQTLPSQLEARKETFSMRVQRSVPEGKEDSVDRAETAALTSPMAAGDAMPAQRDRESLERLTDRHDAQASFTSTLLGQFTPHLLQTHVHEVFQPSRASAPLEPHQVHLDTGEVKVEIMRLVKQGGGQIVMELTPPDQSKFKIDLKIDAQGVASLVVEGASDSTRSRLERGAEGLQQQFSEMGLSLQLDMRQSHDSRTQQEVLQRMQEEPGNTPSLPSSGRPAVVMGSRARTATDNQIHLYA